MMWAMSLPKSLVTIFSILLLLGLVGSGLYVFRERLPFSISKPKKVTLTYWGLFESQEVMEPLISDYQESHPNVTIDYQLQSYPTFSRYKKTLYGRLEQAGGPDIMRVHATWVPQFANYLSPLPSSVMSLQQFGETFYPVALDTCQFQGSIYGLPLMYDGLALLYNKDLFKEAAISSPPGTWREFRDIAVKLTQWKGGDPKERILQAGAAIGASSNITYASDILGLMLSQSEVAVPAQLSSRAAEDVFTFYTNFVLEDRVWDESLASEISAFLAGKVGMIFVPSWEIVRLKRQSPDFSWGVVGVPQVPKLEGGLTNTGWANFWVETVSASSPHPEEAWEFLKFLSERSSQEMLFDTAVQMRGGAFSYSRQDMGAVLSGDKNLSSVIQWAATSKMNPINSCSGNTDYEAAITDAVSGVLSGKRVGIALKAAESTLSSLVDGRSLGLEGDANVCSLASFGLNVPKIELEEEEKKKEEEEKKKKEEVALEPQPSPKPTGKIEEVPLTCLDLSAVPSAGEIPLEVTFSARLSNSLRAKVYRFAFGDGEVDETVLPRVTHVYTQEGTYTASLRIEDIDGNLSKEVEDCTATISARRPKVTEASPSAKAKTGISLPAVLLTVLGAFFMLFGVLL